MRCNKTNILAALGGVAILAMPITASAQSLGVRIGNVSVGNAGTGNTVSVGGIGNGLTGLTSSLTSGASVATVSLPPVTTTGLVAANTGTINANVLGGGSLLSTSVPPITANVGNGLVTLGTPSVGATVLGGGNIATVTLGGSLVDVGPASINIRNSLFDAPNPGVLRNNNIAFSSTVGTSATTVGGVDPSNPVIPISISNPTTTLGADSFFSGTSWRMNGGGGSSGGAGGGSPPTSEGGSAESSAQVCERVLRRPGSFSTAQVSRCRRVVASLQVRAR